MTANSFVLRSRLRQTALVSASLFLMTACGGFDSSKNSVSGVSGSGAVLRLNEVSTGFGQILPHTVRRPGTNELISIRSLADIAENVMRGNGIEPTPTFPTEAVEPDFTPGNHYIYANFTQVIDPLDVLNPSPTSSGLSGPVSVTTINSASGSSLSADGRAFVGGKTLVRPASGGQLELQQWVTYDQDRRMIVPAEGFEDEAQGFPTLGRVVANAATLVSDNTILFVADADDDLTSFETFPQGVTLRFRVTTALRAANGENLTDQVLAATTVGTDNLTPELLRTPPPAERPLITPGNGDINVDPETTIRFEFTEPVQPFSVGEVVGQGPPLLSSAIELRFGPDTGPTSVPVNVEPISPFDLSTYIVTPGFQFPGQGPEFLTCGTFSTVSVAMRTNQIEDLTRADDPNNPGQFVANVNTRSADTFFETGEGPGVVNAPVAPDVIYVGRSGANSGVSVLDLCGFGQSTGNPISSMPFPLDGETRFPYDPNVTQNPSIRPILTAGECTLDGGSAGVFTLTLDSSFQELLATAPLLSSATDIHFGHALDGTFRNSPPPFGCQAGGGNVCALDGIKIISTIQGNQPNTVAPAQDLQFGGGINPGYENVISWAPHPNPPGLSFPPECVSPFLAGSEPTSVDGITNPTTGIVTPIQNLLVTGNPFPIPATSTPPTGLLTLEQNQFFLGPSFGQVDPLLCTAYQIRQQIGHFLYVADRPRNEIVVFNSNRMLVVDRIPVADPTSMAIGPNIDILAVSNQLADTVTFIDINPSSAQFHRVIDQVEVGNSPRGLAFEGSNEDLIVCNELDSSISIVAASNLLVRRTINSQLNRPFELSITPRMTTFSFSRGVYFGYILNRTGTMALFESGPNGVNGWGFDDVVGILPFDFQAPKTIQVDPINLDASVYVVHEGAIDPNTAVAGPLGEGAISRLRIESGLFGQILLTQSGAGASNFRDLAFSVPLSLSQAEGQLSGIPIDIAFDNQRNFGGLPGPRNDFSAGSPIPANNKSTIRDVDFVAIPINASESQFLFAAVPNPVGASGVIDVLALGITGTPRFDTNPYVDGVQSVDVPQVSVLSDYFRQ
jgi:hypothetical protein